MFFLKTALAELSHQGSEPADASARSHNLVHVFASAKSTVDEVKRKERKRETKNTKNESADGAGACRTPDSATFASDPTFRCFEFKRSSLPEFLESGHLLGLDHFSDEQVEFDF